MNTVPAPTEAPSKRTRRKQARPGELLEAALSLFVEKGYAATRVEEVAARAGVSKGTLFLYFPAAAPNCCASFCAAGGRSTAARPPPA